MSFYTAIRLDFTDKSFSYLEENDVILFYNSDHESHSYTASDWRDNHFDLFLQALTNYKYLEINRDFSFYPDKYKKNYPAIEKLETKSIQSASKFFMSMS